jgi:hypothetical protein
MNVMKEKNGRLLSLDVLRDACAAGCRVQRFAAVRL